MELLKQPLERPLSLAEQVITLCAANGRLFIDLPIDQVKDFQMKLLEYMQNEHPEIGRVIEMNQTLDDELNEQILNAVGEFKKTWK